MRTKLKSIAIAAIAAPALVLGTPTKAEDFDFSRIGPERAPTLEETGGEMLLGSFGSDRQKFRFYAREVEQALRQLWMHQFTVTDAAVFTTDNQEAKVSFDLRQVARGVTQELWDKSWPQIRFLDDLGLLNTLHINIPSDDGFTPAGIDQISANSIIQFIGKAQKMPAEVCDLLDAENVKPINPSVNYCDPAYHERIAKVAADRAAGILPDRQRRRLERQENRYINQISVARPADNPMAIAHWLRFGSRLKTLAENGMEITLTRSINWSDMSQTVLKIDADVSDAQFREVADQIEALAREAQLSQIMVQKGTSISLESLGKIEGISKIIFRGLTTLDGQGFEDIPTDKQIGCYLCKLSDLDALANYPHHSFFFVDTTIESLDGVEALENIDSFFIQTTPPAYDITPIADLWQREALGWQYVRAKSIPASPQNSMIKQAEFIGVSLEDWSGLETFHNLEQLTVQDVASINISSVLSLRSLSHLTVNARGGIEMETGTAASQMEFVSLRPLDDSDAVGMERLSNTKSLNIGGRLLTDISWIRSFQSLENLTIQGAPVRDLNSLADLPNLKSVQLGRTLAETIPPLPGVNVSCLFSEACPERLTN